MHAQAGWCEGDGVRGTMRAGGWQGQDGVGWERVHARWHTQGR